MTQDSHMPTIEQAAEMDWKPARVPSEPSEQEIAECEQALHAAWMKEHGARSRTVRPKRRK